MERGHAYIGPISLSLAHCTDMYAKLCLSAKATPTHTHTHTHAHAHEHAHAHAHTTGCSMEALYERESTVNGRPWLIALEGVYMITTVPRVFIALDKQHSETCLHFAYTSSCCLFKYAPLLHHHHHHHHHHHLLHTQPPTTGQLMNSHWQYCNLEVWIMEVQQVLLGPDLTLIRTHVMEWVEAGCTLSLCWQPINIRLRASPSIVPKSFGKLCLLWGCVVRLLSRKTSSGVLRSQLLCSFPYLPFSLPYCSGLWLLLQTDMFLWLTSLQDVRETGIKIWWVIANGCLRVSTVQLSWFLLS